MKLKCLQFIGIACLLTACSPKIVVKEMAKYSKREAYEGLIIFAQNDTTDLTKAEQIGDIQIKDPGLALNCDYEIVLNLAKSKALELGANALYIYEHQSPNLWSSCDRIKAKALRFKNIKPYEKEIIWDARRKLMIADFKGSVLDRPFRAATSSTFSYKTWGRPIDGYATFTVETYFNCTNSYFKMHSDSTMVLQHEQLHFDITELHARKFVKRISTEIKSTKDLNTVGETILKEISNELHIYQDKYDSEVYSDRTKQSLWNETVKIALETYKAYEGKKAKIKYTF